MGNGNDSVTFFVGSIFFTAAALLSYCEVAWVDHPKARQISQRLAELLRPRPARIDWWAALIQFVGTISFNVSTGHVLWSTLGAPSDVNHLVWRPDALGSICFLISSWLSWAEVCDGPWRWLPTQTSWRIAFLNLIGSIAFAASAIASKVEPNGNVRSLALTNLGTFVGAVCFLIGAILLFPERTESAEPSTIDLLPDSP